MWRDEHLWAGGLTAEATELQGRVSSVALWAEKARGRDRQGRKLEEAGLDPGGLGAMLVTQSLS